MTKRSTPQPASFLLVTKLHRPVTSAPLVPRPRLLEELTNGLSKRLTLISAPAGYGKTTVVNQWLDTVDLPSAWISFDEHDSDLATFFGYLLGALRSVYPDADYSSEVLLRAPALPSPDRLADYVLHDLISLPGPLILVLDDYHTLQTLDIHAVMARLVQHLPDHIHLILTTRSDPPLSLERLRGRQQLNEIRSAQLRFTQEEAGELLRQMLGSAATDETTALLEESTEGWAVGLQLVGLSLRGRSDLNAFARRLAQSGHQLAADYLLAEVLERLPEVQRTFLLQTSILDRLCAPLCDAVRGEVGGELTGDGFIRAVRRSNLFLLPLDDEGLWYRYHHLFRHMLRTRLPLYFTAAEIRAMHARASAWFAVQGLLDEAILHAIQAGEVARAAELVEDQVHPCLDREDWRQLDRWIGILPPDALNHPRLLVMQAWLGFIRYQFVAVSTYLDAAQSAMASNPAAIRETEAVLQGEINTLRAVIAYQNDDSQSALRLTETAMKQLRPEMQYATGQACLYRTLALHNTGRYAEAVEFAHKQLDVAYGRQAKSVATRLLLGLCSVHYERAELPALQATATTMQQVARRAGLGLSIAWSTTVLGWIHYQRNDLALAEQYFRNLPPLAHTAHTRAILDGYTGLVLTALAQGRPQEALAAIAMLRELLPERGMLAFTPLAESLQERVALAFELSLALDWRPGGRAAQIPIEFWEQPVLTHVRTLLARGSASDLAQAAELLADSRVKATARHFHGRLIEVAALESLVFAAQGNEAAALASLRQAVELAAPGGALRLLVDCGPGLIGLLRKLQAAGVAPGYIRQVLANFESPARPSEPATPSRHLAEETARPSKPLETLTNREIDVLILLAERLSDKEIATRLVLSPGTVRKHTLHIYSKLGVNNRRAAATQARRMGLI